MSATWIVAVVQALLFGDAHAPDCSKHADPVACLIDARFAKDSKAQALADRPLRARAVTSPRLGVDEIMDGGFRGKIHLVPEPPIGKYRKHLEWVSAAAGSLDDFFTKQFDGKRSRTIAGATSRFASCARSASTRRAPTRDLGANDVWTIEYNVEGSLLTSETGVRETIVHELFHINDEAHKDWSQHTLANDFNAIVKKCGTKVVVPRAVRAERHEGSRDRHLLRVPTEQRQRRARVRRRARGPILQGAVRDARERQASHRSVQVRTGRERPRRGRRWSTSSLRASIASRPAETRSERWRTSCARADIIGAM